ETEKLKQLIEAKKQQLALDQFAAQAASTQLVRNVTIALGEQQKAQEKLTAAKRDFEDATIADITASGKVIRFAEGTKEAMDAQTAATLRANSAFEEMGTADKNVSEAAK